MSWRKKKVELNCSLDKDYMLAGSSRVMTTPQNVLQGLNGLAFDPCLTLQVQVAQGRVQTQKDLEITLCPPYMNPSDSQLGSKSFYEGRHRHCIPMYSTASL
jgi:hypothetical protein